MAQRCASDRVTNRRVPNVSDELRFAEKDVALGAGAYLTSSAQFAVSARPCDCSAMRSVQAAVLISCRVGSSDAAIQ